MLRNRNTYTCCADLPLFNFIKLVVYGDLNWLYSELKKPWLKNIELQPVWDEIFSEYQYLTNDKTSAHVLDLVKLITTLNNKLTIIQSAVDFLSESYDIRLCDMLRKMGFRYMYNPDTLFTDLRLTVSSAKSMILKKMEAEKELEGLNQDESKAPNEKDWNALVAQLSKYMKFKINTKETSVLDFVNYIESFNQENKPKQNG